MVRSDSIDSNFNNDMAEKEKINIRKVKLIITDKGDPSVGIFEQSWVVDFPFAVDPEKITPEDKLELEHFREQIRSIYSDYIENSCIAEYDFELHYPDEI